MSDKPKNISYRDQALRLKKLIQAGQGLAKIEHLGELLPQLLRLAQDAAHAEASSILLFNKRKGVLEFTQAMNDVLGDRAELILKEKVELPLGSGIAGWVAEERTSLNVLDVSSDSRFSKAADEHTGFTTRCMACVPVMQRDELLGVVQVLNAKSKACFDADDMELLESFADLAAVALVRSKLLEQRLKQQRYETQLEAAARIQAHFRPKPPALPDGADIWGVSEAASFVGGDVYDFIPLPDGSWVVYVADVSGKGLPAALIMSALWTRIRGIAHYQMECDTLLAAVNEAVYEIMAQEVFATIILCRFWPESGVCKISLGGHPLPIWINENGIKRFKRIQGIPLGVMPQAEFQKAEIVMEPGDSLLFLTDGVTEAKDKRGRFFDDEGVEDFLRNEAVGPWGPKLMERVKQWRTGIEPNDDTTVVEIRKL